MNPYSAKRSHCIGPLGVIKKCCHGEHVFIHHQYHPDERSRPPTEYQALPNALVLQLQLNLPYLPCNSAANYAVLVPSILDPCRRHTGAILRGQVVRPSPVA